MTPQNQSDDQEILRVKDLEVTYNKSGLGTHGVSLKVKQGEVVGLLGANGAGKTTTLRAITGFLPSDFASVTAGTVTFKGESLGRTSPHRRVGLGVALVPERDKVFQKLTVQENLSAITHRRSRGREDELTSFVYDLFPALHSRRKTSAGYLSGGERQMLGVARALMLSPDLLLADEVSLGIAPILVVKMLDSLREINQRRGTSILIVEQNAAATFRVADYVYILETGRVALEGTPEELRHRPDVREAYLGLGDVVELRRSSDPNHSSASIGRGQSEAR